MFQIRAMDHRRGLLRLWLVGSLLWIVLVTASLGPGLFEVLFGEPWLNEPAFYQARMDRPKEYLALALIPPACAFALWKLATWVFEGFGFQFNRTRKPTAMSVQDKSDAIETIARNMLAGGHSVGKCPHISYDEAYAYAEKLGAANDQRVADVYANIEGKLVQLRFEPVPEGGVYMHVEKLD